MEIEDLIPEAKEPLAHSIGIVLTKSEVDFRKDLDQRLKKINPRLKISNFERKWLREGYPELLKAIESIEKKAANGSHP